MDLKNKLDGFPHVYYFNMDKDLDRRVYMEKQFDQYGLDYTRISGDRFNVNKINDWIDIVDNPMLFSKDDMRNRVLANFVNHIIFLKEWYQSSNDEHIILMEDDYDLSLIDYWHFDWKYLMSRLPFDWDTVQLGYEHFEKIEFFLSHKDYKSFNFGPTLIKRSYVKKLLDLFLSNNKIILQPFSCYGWDNVYSVDVTINHLGKNYTIPLITTNTSFFRNDNAYEVYKRHEINRYMYHYWWKNKRNNFDLDDFFTIYKSNNNQMTEYLFNYESLALTF